MYGYYASERLKQFDLTLIHGGLCDRAVDLLHQIRTQCQNFIMQSSKAGLRLTKFVALVAVSHAGL